MRRRLSIVTIVAAVFAVLYGRYNSQFYTPIVQTSYGQLSGRIGWSREGRIFLQYKGIPYAKIPVGDLRYEPPQPVDKWDGVKHATEFGSMCIQVNSISRQIEGSEDCLYLNVFTPKPSCDFLECDFDKKYPVFVYVHGGYFMAGGSNYMGPLYLMEENIVLVTINYRLNSFGFLNSGDGVIRGNMGMKDQVLALKFVKNEISNFGGDPDNIIIWGESAGAAGVHFHMLSPMSKGLFKKAIMSSGTAIKPWSLSNEPKAQFDLFSLTVGCHQSDTKEMVECLKSKDSRELILAHADALDSPIMDPLKIYAPSIEVIEEGSFLFEHPYDILWQGRAHRVPLLTGVNSHEGLLGTARMFFNKTLAQVVEKNWDTLSPVFFSYNKSLGDVTAKIKDFYFGKTKELNFYSMFDNFTNCFSDRWYIHPFKETIRIQSRYSPVYVYYFNHKLDRGLTFFYDLTPGVYLPMEIVRKLIYEKLNLYLFGQKPQYLGTVHGDELVLLFDFPMLYIDTGHPDYKLSRLMIETWMEFASDETNMFVGSQLWPQYVDSDETKLKYMFFQTDLNRMGILIDEPFSPRMAFWDSIGLPWKQLP